MSDTKKLPESEKLKEYEIRKLELIAELQKTKASEYKLRGSLADVNVNLYRAGIDYNSLLDW